MGLFLKTLKSFSKRERWVSLICLGVFLVCGILLSMGRSAERIKNTVYTEGVVGEIKRLNPVFTEFNEVDADISSLIFSGLVRYDPVSGEFQEDLATHTLSEDKLTYTFTLKNDLYWHDGQAVTAEDVFFTYHDVIQNDDFNNPVLKSNFNGVEIQMTDSRTVTFTLGSPNSFFYTGLSVGILPKHILKDVPANALETDSFNNNPVGTGPYMVNSTYEFKQDGSITLDLIKSPVYYGEEPKIGSIRFVAFPSMADLVENRSVWNGAARIRQSVLDEINRDDLVPYRYELPQYTALFFNTDSPKLAKNKIRLGLSKAIDKQEILDAIGYQAQIDTPLLELNQSEWVHQFDLEQAQGGIFDAGWKLGEGDTVRKNSEGESLTLTLVRRDFSQENPMQEEISNKTAELLQRQLGVVGVEVLIETYPLEELQDIIHERKYDLLLYGQSLGYNLDIFSYWHSSQVTEGGLNLSNYQNPSADFTIERIRQTFDPAEKADLLNSLADIISKDMPAVFLYTPSYYYLVDAKVTGIEMKKILLPKDRFANISLWNLN